MLRASAETSNIALDMTAIGQLDRDPGREDAVALLNFASALVERTDGLDAARSEVARVLGPEAVAGAAGSAGNFEMMNRILDATGVPVPQSMHAIAPLIGVDSTV